MALSFWIWNIHYRIDLLKGKKGVAETIDSEAQKVFAPYAH